VGVEFLQANMTAGELAPTLHSRTDITKYQNGVAEATNMIILPHGGMRRRPGLAKITESKINSKGRLIPFIFNADQSYLVVLRNLTVDIYNNGVLVSQEVTTFTEAQLYEVDFVQSADTMLFTHHSQPTKILQRTGSHTSWSFSNVSFTNAPATWGPTDGYPSCCTFFGGRLYLAGSTAKPTSIWGSKVNAFFDFDLGTGQDDYGIADILDTDQYNKIESLFSGRDLQVFTVGEELYNTSTPITPTKSAWKRQTGYGSTRIRPILIDGATLFVDSSSRTIRQFLFDYTEDSYVSINASLLSSHLITDVVAMDAIKGTQYDVGDYVYIVNADGTVAVLNTMRHEEITGWTHWETDGTFEDVCVINKEVFFLVRRESEYFIERLEEGTYTDHNVTVDGTEPTSYNVIHTGNNVIHDGENIIFTDFSTGSPISEVVTDYDAALLNTTFKVVADFSIMDDATPTGIADDNSFTISRDAYRMEVGLNFFTKVVTLPIATETRSGTTLFRRKRVVKVDINVIESLGIYARNRFVADRSFTVVLDRAPVPFTGFKEMYLLGYDRLAEIEISQKEPLPFILRSLGFEIEY